MDVARAEDQLNSLIQKRSRQRSKANFEEELWKESARRHRERIREDNRWEWVRFFDRLAANHARISEVYEAKARALLEGPDRGEGVR